MCFTQVMETRPFLIRRSVILGPEWFKLLNCVSLRAASDSEALSSLWQRPTWMLRQWIQCVWKGTNEDSVKAVTGKWGRSKPWSRNWSFLLSLQNHMQQLPLIIHKHWHDQSHDVVYFKSGLRKQAPPSCLFWQIKLLNGRLLRGERGLKALRQSRFFFFHSTSGLKHVYVRGVLRYLFYRYLFTCCTGELRLKTSSTTLCDACREVWEKHFKMTNSTCSENIKEKCFLNSHKYFIISVRRRLLYLGSFTCSYPLIFDMGHLVSQL